MSHFSTTLQTELVDEFDNIHRLLAPLVYWSDLLGCAVTVPKGFRTDFASTPRLPFAYLVVGGKGDRAAVVHDFLYSGGMLPSGRIVCRHEADLVLREALAASGYGWLVQNLMYAGVRVGGESHFTGPNVPQPEHVAAAMNPVDFEAP